MDNAIVQEMGEIADKAYTSYLKGATFTVEDKTYTVIATQADIPEIVANDSGFQGLLLQDNTGKFVFAFRGTEADSPVSNWAQFYKDLLVADIAYMGKIRGHYTC